MKKEIKELLYDGYKVLEVMYEYKIEYIKGSFKSDMSRNTLAELSGYNEWKVKYLIKQLIKREYLEEYENKRGQYIITKKAISAVKILK